MVSFSFPLSQPIFAVQSTKAYGVIGTKCHVHFGTSSEIVTDAVITGVPPFERAPHGIAFCRTPLDNILLHTAGRLKFGEKNNSVGLLFPSGEVEFTKI